MGLIECKNVCKSFGEKVALDNVSVDIPKGKIFGLLGPNGAGKSTMLYLLAGLDVPTQGSILYNGQELKRAMLDGYRRTEVATIAQNYLLFPTRTALENVLYPLELAKVEKNAALQEAKRHLASVGIPGELHHRLPSKLSGGEQQRVAIARAIVNEPSILLADEPTGNLDPANSWEIMKLLEEANNRGTTVIVVTHNHEIVNAMKKRVVTMQKGNIVSDTKKVGV